MVFSILGLVNFAHGELVTVAAYTMYLENEHGVPFAVQVPSAIIAAAVAAVLMERVAFRPLRGASFLTLLFSSFAISVIIQNLFLAAVSPRQKGVRLPDVFNEAIHIGGFTIGWLQVLTTITCLGALGVLTLFLRRSTQGLGMLARVAGLPGDAADGHPREPGDRDGFRDLGCARGRRGRLHPRPARDGRAGDGLRTGAQGVHRERDRRSRLAQRGRGRRASCSPASR